MIKKIRASNLEKIIFTFIVILAIFFLVLSSWYVLRAVRNELAVENYSDNFLIILYNVYA